MEKTYNFKRIQNLKHGENTFQQANLYNYDKEIDWSLIQGLELNYNDILNSTTTVEILAEFFDVAAITIVNHSNPSVVALASDVNQAFEKAMDSDPIAPFNSTIGFSREINPILARKLIEFPINIIIAPSFNEETLKVLNKNPNIKLIQINNELRNIQNFLDEEIKLTPFGALIQERDKKDLDVKSFKVVTKKKPEQKEVEDMIFAYKIAKHVKSPAVVVAKDLRTTGICSGQTNLTDSTEIAISKICDSPKDSIIATDMAIENKDTLQSIIQNRISSIIQPMGSTKDREIIEYADKMQLSMISTGITHIKH